MKLCTTIRLSFYEDIVEAAPSFNLIDEENDDEELEYCRFFLFCRVSLFYVRRKSPKFYKRPLSIKRPLE